MTTGVVLVAFLVIAAAVHLVQGRLLQGRLHRKEVPGRDPGPDLR